MKNPGWGLGFSFLRRVLCRGKNNKKADSLGDDNKSGKGKGKRNDKSNSLVTVCIPPIAKCAMDGAPVLLWLAKES
jgi:hypothetical protein